MFLAQKGTQCYDCKSLLKSTFSHDGKIYRTNESFTHPKTLLTEISKCVNEGLDIIKKAQRKQKRG